MAPQTDEIGARCHIGVARGEFTGNRSEDAKRTSREWNFNRRASEQAENSGTTRCCLTCRRKKSGKSLGKVGMDKKMDIAKHRDRT